MSTKGTLSSRECRGKNHKLEWHVYTDLHQEEGTIVVELSCSTCYCSYQFLMDKHLGEQLVDILKKHEKDK